MQATNALKVTACPAAPGTLLSKSGLQISTGPRPCDLLNPRDLCTGTVHQQVSPSFTDQPVCVLQLCGDIPAVYALTTQALPQRGHKLTPAVHQTLDAPSVLSCTPTYPA